MNKPSQCPVTVAVVPRERFSLLQPCIEQIYRHTREPFQLIVMDTNTSAGVARQLRECEKTHPNCRVIRTERFLSPYEAKNLLLEEIATEWVAFVDNDVMVGPDWLTHLLSAAQETGARVVHPLYLVEQAGTVRIHMTDGRIKRIRKNGEERLHPVMGHVAQEVSEAKGLTRQESDFVEFHTFLIHRDLLKRLGPFEPFTLAEDVNYSLRLRELKEKIVFEPKAVITYVAGPPFERYDLPYWRFRWNLKQAKESAERLRQRWPLTDEYCASKLAWVTYHHTRASPWFTLSKQWKRRVGELSSHLVKQVRGLRKVSHAKS